jgi:hypothetical protein
LTQHLATRELTQQVGQARVVPEIGKLLTGRLEYGDGSVGTELTEKLIAEQPVTRATPLAPPSGGGR